MSLKTFNVSEEVYRKYSELCKAHGISMSKQVEIFMMSQTAEEPEVRKEYLEKLENIRKGKFLRVKNFAKTYGLE